VREEIEPTKVYSGTAEHAIGSDDLLKLRRNRDYATYLFIVIPGSNHGCQGAMVGPSEVTNLGPVISAYQ